MPEIQPSLLPEGGALVVAPGPPFCLFELGGKPRGKGSLRHRVVIPKSGRPFAHGYTDEETAAYMEALGWAARAAMKGKPCTHAPVCLMLHAFVPIPASWSEREKNDARLGASRPTGKPDDDNYRKILDALNSIVWHDDAQVVEDHIYKFYSDDPALRIEVREFIKPRGT